MKEGIHPKYEDAVITCACGEVIHTRSTKKELRVDVCSKCHPFYTGKQKLVDSGGRVDRFKSVSALRTKAKLNRKRDLRGQRSLRPFCFCKRPHCDPPCTRVIAAVERTIGCG